ncbi:MAG TPA: TadE/TadG family type IV pilus assembly protein [Mycobacteriales bacterium]|jgi:Flp pilus assembly protein TadG|nr:TadE/TadG family type IV pilus assembly protein [Mycobacteriales bacterium]
MPRVSPDRGSATLELAFVAPALGMLAALGLETALWLHAQHVALAAARQGVRAVAVERGTTAAGEIRATDYLAALGSSMLSDVTVSATRTSTTARVRIHAHAISLLPGIHLTVDETAERPVERFVVIQ